MPIVGAADGGRTTGEKRMNGGWKMVEDGLANGNKRGKLTGDETNDNVDWRIAERVAFEQMVRHTHTHNASHKVPRSLGKGRVREEEDETPARGGKPPLPRSVERPWGHPPRTSAARLCAD